MNRIPLLTLLALCLLPVSTAFSDHIVYKVVSKSSQSFWHEDKDNGTTPSGRVSVVLEAFVIHDSGNASQGVIFINSRSRKYSLGQFGTDLEFIEDRGTDPFLPSLEVNKVYIEKRNGRQQEVWCYADRDFGSPIFDDDGNLVMNGIEPLFTTEVSGRVQKLEGEIRELRWFDGFTRFFPPVLKGEGRKWMNDDRHFELRWVPDPNLENLPPGLHSVSGRRHAYQKTGIAYAYLGLQSKLANATTPLLDDTDQPVTPGTNRYAVLSVIKWLRSKRFTPAS